MSLGWKYGLGWGEELSEKGSVKQTSSWGGYYDDTTWYINAVLIQGNAVDFLDYSLRNQLKFYKTTC